MKMQHKKRIRGESIICNILMQTPLQVKEGRSSRNSLGIVNNITSNVCILPKLFVFDFVLTTLFYKFKDILCFQFKISCTKHFIVKIHEI